MRERLSVMAWGVAGVVITAALVFGAYAVAGAGLMEPATPIHVSVPALAPSASKAPHDAARPEGGSSTPSAAASATETDDPAAHTTPEPSPTRTREGSDEGEGRPSPEGGDD